MVYWDTGFGPFNYMDMETVKTQWDTGYLK